MSHDENKHIITINNFNDGELVTYSIIKLLGSIETKDSTIPCQNQDLDINLKLNKSDRPILSKIIDNKFKLLVELENGKNDITLRYCCHTVNIAVQYEPRESTYSVVPLYVICDGHDGYFQSPSSETNDVTSACQRIFLCSKLLQCVTAEKLYEHGLGRKTFCLEKDCRVFRSKLNYLEARKMNPEQLWQNIGREIMTSDIGFEDKKYLAFLSCTIYHGDQYFEYMKTHEELMKITEGYVALGGGGLALFGTGCLYTWPENVEEIISRFEDSSVIDRSRFLDDSCYRSTKGACFSTTLGSVLHELYHTFNLGHTQHGIMGRGFDNIYKFFTMDLNYISHEIAQTFQSQIEFKEEFEAETLSERLQKENQKKEFKIIRKFEEVDDTFLTKSCAVTLCYHRWFNSQSSSKQPSILQFDEGNKFIKSTAGIRVVEIRKETNEMVMFNWTFEGKVIKFSFQIPEEVFLCKENVIVFVEDTTGNILKENIQLK